MEVQRYSCGIVTTKKDSSYESLIVSRTNFPFAIILRNQCSENSITQTGNIMVIRSTDTGASKNRNEVIKKIETEYFFILDDDVSLAEDCLKCLNTIIDRNHPDVISFNLDTINKDRENPKKIQKDGWVKRMKMVTFLGPCNLCIRKDFIKEKNVYFNENFGPGTPYPIGEDSAFVVNLFKNTKRWFQTKETLVKVLQNESTYFDSINEETIIKCKGITYYSIYKICWFIPFIIKSKRFLKTIKLIKALRIAKKEIKAVKPIL